MWCFFCCCCCFCFLIAPSHVNKSWAMNICKVLVLCAARDTKIQCIFLLNFTWHYEKVFGSSLKRKKKRNQFHINICCEWINLFKITLNCLKYLCYCWVQFSGWYFDIFSWFSFTMRNLNSQFPDIQRMVSENLWSCELYICEGNVHQMEKKRQWNCSSMI